MPADVTPTTPDPRPIYRLIRRTRRLLRSTWVATGLGLTVGLALGTLVTATVLDLLAPVEPGRATLRLWGTALALEPLVRLAALLVVVVPALWAFFTGVLRPLARRLTYNTVARRIESTLPGIHNRLVSCIVLDARGQGARTSPVFYRRLLTEALERIRGFHPRRVLDLM